MTLLVAKSFRPPLLAAWRLGSAGSSVAEEGGVPDVDVERCFVIGYSYHIGRINQEFEALIRAARWVLRPAEAKSL